MSYVSTVLLFPFSSAEVPAWPFSHLQGFHKASFLNESFKQHALASALSTLDIYCQLLTGTSDGLLLRTRRVVLTEHVSFLGLTKGNVTGKPILYKTQVGGQIAVGKQCS